VADPHAFSKSMYKMLNMAMQAGLDLDSVSAAPEVRRRAAARNVL